MREQTCCFTGHRKIPAEEVGALTARLEGMISSLYKRGIRRFEIGGALGFDTLAAQSVLRLREKYHIELALILPCLSQTRNWRPEDIMEYERIKTRADQVLYTSQHYFRGCMHKRNRYLVDTSSICVCYLTRDSGGTAYTVHYAQARGLEIINLA